MVDMIEILIAQAFGGAEIIYDPIPALPFRKSSRQHPLHILPVFEIKHHFRDSLLWKPTGGSRLPDTGIYPETAMSHGSLQEMRAEESPCPYDQNILHCATALYDLPPFLTTWISPLAGPDISMPCRLKNLTGASSQSAPTLSTALTA